MNIELDEYIVCMLETKVSHNIPRLYTHAMATNPDRWMLLMKVEMETLKKKHTWDLVKPPPGVNVMGSMWVYDIKWDGEGNRIKDKARLVGKGYTQQLSVDYNETWAGVTRLESVRMTAVIAAKHDLKLWEIDFVGAYLTYILGPSCPNPQSLPLSFPVGLCHCAGNVGGGGMLMVTVGSGDVATDGGAGILADRGKKDLRLFEEAIPVIQNSDA